MSVPQSRSWVPAWGAMPRWLPARILLTGSVLVTLGFFICCAIVLLDAREDAARQADQATWNTVSAVEQEVARTIELLDASLRGMNDRLQLPDIQQLSAQSRGIVLFDGIAQDASFGFLSALNEVGDVIAESAPKPYPGNFAGTDYFKFHQHDLRGSLFIGKPLGRAEPISIAISRRVSHPDGTFAGVIVGSIKLAYFRTLFEKLNVGPHGSITLLRTDGMILMQTPFDINDIGRTVGSSSGFFDFIRTGAPRVETESQIDHVLRRFAYKRIGDLPLVLSVGFAVDDVFAAWRIKATGILALVGMLCVTNLGLTVLFRQQVRQRAAAELAARRREAAFRRLTESVSDIVAQIDEAGVYLYVSPASLRLLGKAPDILIGHRMADDLHPDDRAAFDLWLEHLRHDTAESTTRFRQRRPDGTEVWLEAAASRLIDPATSTPQGFVILSRDATARHRLDISQSERERELEQSNTRLAALAEQHAKAIELAEQAGVVKTRFLATMSHELRSPLNSILGYAELLALEGGLDNVQSERVAAMRSAGAHLRDVINSVLDQSRHEAETAPPTPARTDLGALIGQCRAQIEPAAAAKGLRLICEVTHDAPRAVFADGVHLRQILINLLQNAVKFTRQGTITLRITSDTNWLHCAVADTGPGIPADQRDRLFREYERLDADRATIEGSGLGLTIAARLVHGMGGHIGHEDNPGGGAVFWLEVPIGTPATVQAHMRSRDVTASRPLRVLVVDDSAANLDVAASFLRGGGHLVTTATDGEAAMRVVSAQDFDVVLMDIGMAGMDGLETTRRIRALPGTRGDVPIIAVTAQVLDNQWTAWRAAGIDEYLAKPYERAELLTGVALAALPREHTAAVWPVPGVAEAASLTFGVEALFDPDILAPLEACLAPDRLAAHQVALAAGIEAMLALLGDGTVATDELAAIVHAVAGDGGQLGWLALTAAARGFLAADEPDRTASGTVVTRLREVAEKSLAMLCQRLESARSAAKASATLA